MEKYRVTLTAVHPVGMVRAVLTAPGVEAMLQPPVWSLVVLILLGAACFVQQYTCLDF